ncbi:PREDICTED: uncharacterized protein C8orf76-like [Nanorana parkeri]|uniref:uncharacterized protein C8orf76-like n=1 Tax=Nanorana parkeri TaxID=125878 RepID=UPI0008549693|nr:PREDICTED: uncharacterized protein C8orf76-like [Nanorana parkeri]
MEFDFSFEDSVFSESRDRSAGRDVSYTAKQCEPQWFCEDVKGDDPSDEHTVRKFRADLSYRQENFLKAFDEYRSCYELLPAANNAMRRDVLESQARCLIHLGRPTEALEIVQSLMKGVNNTDHLTGALNLQVTIHIHLGNLEDAVSDLQQLVTLHSFNPHFWISLAESYRSLSSAASHCTNASVNTSEPSVREHLCVNDSLRIVDTSNLRDNKTIQRHCSKNNTFASILDCCRNSAQLWIWSCASFIRARLLLNFIQHHHASFALDQNLKTQNYIEEQLNQMELAEESKTIITNVMSEDLLAERIQEEGHIETKSTQALNTFVMPTDTEFKEKWFKKIQSLLLVHR